jgi:hypothetical protein
MPAICFKARIFGTTKIQNPEKTAISPTGIPTGTRRTQSLAAKIVCAQPKNSLRTKEKLYAHNGKQMPRNSSDTAANLAFCAQENNFCNENFKKSRPKCHRIEKNRKLRAETHSFAFSTVNILLNPKSKLYHESIPD